MAGQSRVEFLQAQTLAAAPSVAHGIAIKRYGSARGRRDIRTEALVSSDESEDSDAGSMVAQSMSACRAGGPQQLEQMHERMQGRRAATAGLV